MIHHVQLACPPGSEPALREFYRNVLGLDEIPKPPALAARGGCWFGGHGVELHLAPGPASPFRAAAPPARDSRYTRAPCALAWEPGRVVAAG
ncbi:MAG TPA: hypothetical protein VEG33_06390 [Streptosporangiaceae bacterium]|nr:hypothetical protein [Streptosporangiaceae bacterium]